MKRRLSKSAQRSFDVAHKLIDLSLHSTLPVRLLARAANKLVWPISRSLGAVRLVSATVYGRSLTMPAEHPLPATVMEFPRYNRPLGLAVEAIRASDTGKSVISVIDVGANIGETIAIIEDHCPGKAFYLCLEADDDLAELCKLNHAGNDRVQVEQCYVGEEEGTRVRLEDDGRANPSTKRILGDYDEPGHGKLVRLDTIAIRFAEANRGVSLIKVDTEGYDFSVLRSAPNILAKYKPAIYFEWYPKLLVELHENTWSGFEYLASFGYRHFVFFIGRGDYYCKVSDPDRLLLQSLASIAMADESVEYFDVFASPQEEICNKLVQASIENLDSQKKVRSRRLI